MARPIFNRPMTAAERMRRYRARQRDGSPARITRRECAKIMGVSERIYYAIDQFQRYAAFRWHPDIIAGKHGRLGWHFLAIVCSHGSAAQQRLIHDTIRRDGATAGRATWRKLLRDRSVRPKITTRGGEIETVSTRHGTKQKSRAGGGRGGAAIGHSSAPKQDSAGWPTDGQPKPLSPT
jgi:hypothetical protein